MNFSMKLALFGACALAASSTAALANSQLLPGVSTGIALGAPLPEGVYAVTIGTYGSRPNGFGAGIDQNLAVGIPLWLIWSTPWQIAGGRIMLDTATPLPDVWAPGGIGVESWYNTLLGSSIKWNFGNGWNLGLMAGVWLPSTQALPVLLGRNFTQFQGAASVSYLANGWNLTATSAYGTGGGGARDTDHWGAEWVNLDLTGTKKFGKYETGVVAYGNWDLSTCGALCPKQSRFAVGGLAGYDFGSFSAQFKLTYDVAETNHGGKETRGWVTFVKPLWSPEPPMAPLK
jgi:hypothetical protein